MVDIMNFKKDTMSFPETERTTQVNDSTGTIFIQPLLMRYLPVSSLAFSGSFSKVTCHHDDSARSEGCCGRLRW